MATVELTLTSLPTSGPLGGRADLVRRLGPDLEDRGDRHSTLRRHTGTGWPQDRAA